MSSVLNELAAAIAEHLAAKGIKRTTSTWPNHYKHPVYDATHDRVYPHPVGAYVTDALNELVWQLLPKGEDAPPFSYGLPSTKIVVE